MSGDSETVSFEENIKLLLDEIQKSSGNKDYFLAQLIFMSSHSLRKFYYKGHSHPPDFGTGTDLYTKITPNKDDKTLTIMDTGIGMTKEDLVNNFGGKSLPGTQLGVRALQAGADISILRQFGVGFYAAFMVADLVVITTKNNEDYCYRWESRGQGSFIVTTINDPDLARGTKITMHLKETDVQYLEEDRLMGVIDLIFPELSFPLRLGSIEIPASQPPDVPTQLDALATYLAYLLDDAENKGIEEYITITNKLF